MFIPEYFLDSEVRDGFYIPAKMKRCWASILDVLNEIAIICNRHNIKWWMDWGTMLGLIRHGGYIPWDDDVDISMMRPDYERFLKYAKDELPKGYNIANIYNNHDYIDSLSRVVNSTKIKINQEFLEANHGFPYVSGVDVMPIDYIPRDKERLEKEIELIRHLHGLASSIDEDALYKDIPEYHGNVNHLENELRKSFSRTKPIAQQAEIFNQQIMSAVGYEDADMAASMGAYATRDHFAAVFPKEYYEDFIVLNYEFIEVPVPIHYDWMLKKVFGNYMKPYRAGGTHEYPVYIRQERVLLDEIHDVAWSTCKFDRSMIAQNKDKKEIVAMDGNSSNTPEKKKDVLFLITKASNWIYMKKEYEKASADTDNNVYVIPIPYYERTNTMGIGTQIHYEGKELAATVNVTGFDKYDFFGSNPDIIYFDNPYDTFDAHTVVYPMFYTDKLRHFAKKLVYISCIHVDDYGPDDGKAAKMMEFCINTPGVARADVVIVQSDIIRDRYIESLTKWAGEDTKEIWEKKIVTGGDGSDEIEEYPKVKDEELAPEWLEFLSDRDGNRRKIVLVYISISGLVDNKERAVVKLKEIFDLFKENKDSIVLYYHPDINIEKYLGEFEPELYKGYREIIDSFINEDYGIYDDGEDDSFMVRLCDAYYGDNGSTMYHFMRAKKPVMAINYEV
ncbi:MAG: LicD family protein [Lachnospiraceae bacterium]|nr:LicD family protein [Lachnospiraceae bacterium]